MSVVPPARSPSSSGGSSSRLVVGDLATLRMMSRIAAQVGEGVAVSDNDGWFLYVNPEFAQQHAATVEELTGVHLSSFYREEDFALVEPIITAALDQGIGRGDVIRLRRDGTRFPARITLSLLRDDSGTLIGRVLCVQDISARRKLEEELRAAALYDPLTELPNRRLLRDRIEHALAFRGGRRTRVAALFVDLDGFKEVNDASGHDVGDQVLVEVARRLSGCVRECDTLARHGGDEYVMLIEGVTDEEQLTLIVQRVLAAFAEPVVTTVGQLAVSASIGVHLASEDDDYDSMLRAADHAMYNAKRSGPGRIRFSPAQSTPALPAQSQD